MTIIKHGNPKERLHFGCPECGCEWRARVGETEKNLLGYQMRCPDCGIKIFLKEVNDDSL